MAIDTKSPLSELVEELRSGIAEPLMPLLDALARPPNASLEAVWDQLIEAALSEA